ELQLAGHLVQDVFERRINTLQHLADVIVGAKHRAEAHRDDGVTLHYGFDHVFVGESVFTGRVEHVNRRVADHSGDILVVHRVHHLALSADTHLAELHGLVRLDDAVDVTTALAWSRINGAGRRFNPHVYIFAANAFHLGSPAGAFCGAALLASWHQSPSAYVEWCLAIRQLLSVYIKQLHYSAPHGRLPPYWRSRSEARKVRKENVLWQPQSHQNQCDLVPATDRTRSPGRPHP